MERFCLKCGCPITGRKWCNECRKENKREYVKRRYAEMSAEGIKKLRYGLTNCVHCDKEIIKIDLIKTLAMIVIKRITEEVLKITTK